MRKGWNETREKNFFEKIKLTVNNIHYVMVRNEFKGSFYEYKKKNILVMKVGYILLNNGIIVNHGNNMKPAYEWAGRVPDDKMFEEVRDALRYTYPTTKQKPAPKAVVAEPAEKEIKVVVDNVLSRCTDAELWGELVNRGYYVADSRILKTVYLN